MRELFRDLQYGWRTLTKNSVFACTAVLSLTLGIGSVITLFTLVNAVLLRPLPVHDPASLAQVFTLIEGTPGHFPVSFLNYKDYRERSKSWSDLAAFMTVTVSLTGQGEPLQVDGELVTANLFDALGVRALLGRTFLREEDNPPGAHPVAVLSYDLWHSNFGADNQIVGKMIEINAQDFTVVGIAPKGFKGLSPFYPTQLWLPMSMHRQILPTDMRPLFELRRPLMVSLLGRFAEGVHLQQAEREMQVIAGHLATQFPAANERRTVALIPLMQTTISPDERPLYVRAGKLLMGVSGLVLFIACANVANMLLARASHRHAEIALRLALGASRTRLVRQLLTESLMLSLTAGGTGLIFAVWARKLFVAFESPYLPSSVDLGFDAPVLILALAVSLATTFVCGLMPAMQATRPDSIASLRNDLSSAQRTTRRFGLNRLLIATQVALSVVCLIGTTVFARSLQQAHQIDLGFEPENLLLVSFDLDGRGYEEAQGMMFLRWLRERMEALPGVRSTALAASLQLDPGSARMYRTTVIEGREENTEASPVAQINVVDEGYFETMGISILRGRRFSQMDRQGVSKVAIVNQTMVRSYWPDQDPIGRRFTFLPENETLTVVGVAQDSKYNALGEIPQPYVYLPLQQNYIPSVTLHVRTERNPELLQEAVSKEIKALDPGLPTGDRRTMSQILAGQLWAPRMGAALLACFTVIALALTVIGIYGVTSYAVSQRNREIGIRLALGAGQRKILGLIVGESMRPVLLGLLLGLATSYTAARWIASLLFGIQAAEPLSFGMASFFLALVALAASYVPARRAAVLDPMLLLATSKE